VAPLDKLSAAFSIPHEKIDGNDVLLVADAARAAVQSIRAGNGPRVLECITHRWRGHYEGDPQKYRPSEEIEGLGEHDPVARFEAVLDKQGVAKSQRQQAYEEVQAQVERAVERARQGRSPVWQAARNDVYTTTEAN
jgi:pyruvate dehydrogenase E1 component alpha subunit